MRNKSIHLEVPPEILKEIKEYILEKNIDTKSIYQNNKNKEDVITGAFFSQLTKKSNKKKYGNSMWSWQINFKSFGSGGKNSAEKQIGADGIFELICDYGGNSIKKKSALFQAKTDFSSDLNLFEQCKKMMCWNGAAFVINYTQEKFEVFEIDSIIKAKGERKFISDSYSIESFINDYFLECRIGSVDINYDKKNERLIWRPYLSKENIFIDFHAKTNLEIKIIHRRSGEKINRIDQESIMNVQYHLDPFYGRDSPDPTINNIDNLKALKKAKHSINKKYHTDTLDEYRRELYGDLYNEKLRNYNEQIEYKEKEIKEMIRDLKG